MSNHWVGYAMAEISGEVCELLDHGELSFNHARKLIDLMQKVVGKNDGNSYEMWYGLEDRCCVCLRKCVNNDLIGAYDRYADNDPRFSRVDTLIQMYKSYKAYGPHCCIQCVDQYAKEQLK